MLPALATTDELEVRLEQGFASERDEARAQAALNDASALVRDEARKDFLDENEQPNAPDAIKRVVLAAALRDFRNPEGFRTETDTAGPFAKSGTRSDDETSAYLTEEEKAICARYREAGTSGLWNLSVTRNEYKDTTLWVEDSFGLEPFPIGDKYRWWE